MPRLFLGHFGFGGYDTRIASGLGPEGKELQLEFLGISVVILKPLAFESELFPCSRGHVFERPQSFLVSGVFRLSSGLLSEK
jgi:hypothetical protein